MGGSKNNVSTAHLGERFVRHPLTKRNLKELKIADNAVAILERNKGKLKRKAERKTAHGKDRYITPTGFALNKGRFGDFPEGEDSAHQRGWLAYMTVGVPLIEERADIAQPPPDVISKQTYVNRTDPTPTKWTHSVEFSIQNQISWTLQGQVQLTFGAKAIASLQQQLQKSMAMNQSQKMTNKKSPNNSGTDTESQTQSTDTTTATSTATGTGELSAQLMLGITASVSGSLTTAFKTTSMLSGEVASRVDVLATQRRQVRRFDYEFPITFGGWLALYYPEPVEVEETRPDGPQAEKPEYSKVIAWKLGESGADEKSFDLTDDGRPFTQKGEAEVVSTLAGMHEVFELEELSFDAKHHPLHKVGGEKQETSEQAPVEIASGLGEADGLALDPVNQKVYVAERHGGKLHKVDLASRNTDWVLPNLGHVNDVALDLPGNKAYITDWSGRRLFTVDLSNHSAPPVTVADEMNAYGVALDLPGNRAYVTDVEGGKLIELGLNSEPGKKAKKLRTWDVPRAAGVALNGGKAYVGQYDRGELYEINLEMEGGSPRKVASALGNSVRVALADGGTVYVCDPAGNRMHEVVVADDETKVFQRVVASSLGPVCGIGLDRNKGVIYVSNRSGKLLQIHDVLPQTPAKP